MQHKPQSQRQLKVGEMLRHALSDLFLRGDFYAASKKLPPITVSEIRVSPDLRNATVFIMPLGGIEKDRVLKDVRTMAPILRTEVAHKVQLRYSPELFFKLDESFDNAAKLDTLLRQ